METRIFKPDPVRGDDAIKAHATKAPRAVDITGADREERFRFGTCGGVWLRRLPWFRLLLGTALAAVVGGLILMLLHVPRDKVGQTLLSWTVMLCVLWSAGRR